MCNKNRSMWPKYKFYIKYVHLQKLEIKKNNDFLKLLNPFASEYFLLEEK